MFHKIIFFLIALFCLQSSFLFAQKAVLYTGSDWCDAGVPLQQIWESEAFRKAAGMPLAIVDEPEQVTDAVKAEWKALEAIRFELEAYPGVAVFDEKGQCVLLREGLPWNTTDQQLVALIEEGRQRAKTINTLLTKKTIAGAEEAIRLLLPELGLKRTRQANGLKAAWDFLEQRDAKDENGIRAALSFDPMSTIYKVHEFAKNKDYQGGEAYIKGLLTPAAIKHLTVNQKQGLLLHTFVLYRHDDTQKAANIARLREVLALDPTTHFGHGAYGMLKLLGETVDPIDARPAPLPLKPRTQTVLPAQWKSPLKTSPYVATKPVYTYASMVISDNTIQTICEREGGAAFLEAFLADETWLCDFFGSGPAKPSWDESLKMLEELAWQVPLTDRGLKKWATAAALNASEGNREAVLRMMIAFADIRSRKLLVRGVEDLPVGLLRYVLTPAQTSAEEMLWMAKTHNVPPRAYSGVCWYAPYRTFNFFGDSIHGADYYKPWDHAYNRREAARKIGGVCGSLSYYGSCAAKAHGLPSSPGGQPAHCAYSLFIPAEMRWWLCYNVNPYTGSHFQLFHWSFDYLPLAADTFLAPNRQSALKAFWKTEVSRMKDELQPERSPMTCTIYADWKGTQLPKPTEMPPATRIDKEVTTFNIDQAGNAHRDHVILTWDGTFTFKKDSNVEFTLTSDDGSDLIFDGTKIIDNNGRHAMVTKDAKIKVKAGKHPFTLRYFNYDYGRGLNFTARVVHPYNPRRAAAYAQAARRSPHCYDILDAWEKWLAQANNTPQDAWEAFIKVAAKGLSAHPRPAWDLLSRNALAQLEKTYGKKGLARWLARLHTAIRQDDRPVDEFCNFAEILNQQAALLENDDQRFALFCGALVGQVGTKNAFSIVMRWGGNRFLKDPKMAKLYVAAVGKVLKEKGQGTDIGKFIDGAIREASAASNLTAFHSLTDLRNSLLAADARKPRDFSFTTSPILSDKGLLRISTTSQWDHPGNYRAVIDGLAAAGNFHTASETAPWAEVELPGMAMIDTVFIENIHTQNNYRAIPFKLEISEDGKTWQQVATAEKSQEEWIFKFTPVKGRFVRVTWTGNGKTFLHFRKFTVHGKKLY